jgi:hypothetical protein
MLARGIIRPVDGHVRSARPNRAPDFLRPPDFRCQYIDIHISFLYDNVAKNLLLCSSSRGQAHVAPAAKPSTSAPIGKLQQPTMQDRFRKKIAGYNLNSNQSVSILIKNSSTFHSMLA